MRRTGEQEHAAELYRKLPEWLNSQDCIDLYDLSSRAVWEEGRQGTGYKKFSLVGEKDGTLEIGAEAVVSRALDTLGNPPLFDAYLLEYPVGSEIPLHTDPAAQDGMCHVRLNAIVIGGKGGELSLGGVALPLAERDAYIFRPDEVSHEVSVIQEGIRLVFSVGALMEPDQARAIGLA